MPRFSANLHFLFNERPFLERFAAARAVGFTAVEFPDPYSYEREALAAALRDNGLSCALMNLPMGNRAQGEMGIACLPDRVAEFRDGVARAVDIARHLRCPRLNCLAGRVPAGAARADLLRMLEENLRFCARSFAAAGLTVCLEPINSFDVPDFLLTGSQATIDLLNQVGEPNLKLQFDCYHLGQMEEDLAATITRLLPAIGHIQIADVPGRHEPGTGRVPYAQLFAHLDHIGYQGWVGAEYRPSQRTEETFAWKAAAEAASPDEAAMARATVEYYDGRPVLGDAWDGEPTGPLADVTEEERRMESAMRETVRGRQVLEVACGTAPWTRLAAEVATSVLGTDSGETCIRLAREAGPWPPGVTFEVCDAFDLSGLPGGFSAGISGGFFHLVPKRRQAEFLQTFHGRLAPGARVFLCATRTRTERGKKRQFQSPHGPDLLCRRDLKDGRSFVIVNNEFDEAELRRIFEPVGRDLQVEVGDAWWWVTYTI
jgi:hydroxypyruvate isomerase